MSGLTDKCERCGTEYLRTWGHKNCPKDKQEARKKQPQDKGEFKPPPYTVQATAKVADVTLGVSFPVWEKDKVKDGLVEAFYLTSSTVTELLQKGIAEATK